MVTNLHLFKFSSLLMFNVLDSYWCRQQSRYQLFALKEVANYVLKRKHCCTWIVKQVFTSLISNLVNSFLKN